MKPDPDDNLLAIVVGVGMIYLLYVIFTTNPILWQILVALYALSWIPAIVLAVALMFRLCVEKLSLWATREDKRQQSDPYY